MLEKDYNIKQNDKISIEKHLKSVESEKFSHYSLNGITIEDDLVKNI